MTIFVKKKINLETKLRGTLVFTLGSRFGFRDSGVWWKKQLGQKSGPQLVCSTKASRTTPVLKHYQCRR